MADGSVRIEVGLSTRKAEKELEKLREKIFKAEAELNANTNRKSEIEKQLDSAAHAAEAARQKVKELKQAYSETRGSSRIEVKAQLDHAMANYRDAAKDADKLGKEYDKVNEKIEKQTANIGEMKDQAGAFAKEVAAAKPGEALANSLSKAKSGLMTFLKYAVGIRTVFVLFRMLRNGIKDSVLAFAEYDEETKNNIEGLKQALEGLKLSWGAAFAPILNAVAPLIKQLIDWLNEAGNAVSRFIAILSGRTTYKRVVQQEEGIAKGLEDITKKSEAAKKSLVDFDEINPLNALYSGTDDKTKLSYKIEEVPTDPFDESYLGKLATTVKSVLFDWTDLNPEQIAQKFIAGLSGLLGAALAISLGLGPGGVLVMTLLGVGLGILLDSLIFDNDGRISGTELAKMLMIGLSGLLVGISWFLITGNPTAGLVGTILGGTLGFMVSNLVFDNDKTLSKSELEALIYPILNAIAGGALGLVFTGTAAGAGIGAVIGLGITMLIETFKPQISSEAGKTFLKDFTKALTYLGGLAIGAGIGFKVGGGPIGGIVGGLVGVVAASLIIDFVDAKIEAAEIASKAKEMWESSDFKAELDSLKEQIEESAQLNLDIQARVSKIDGSIDDDTLAKLSLAADTVERIFNIADKDNKTAEEIEELKGQVELLNSLGLSGVKLSFDELTGAVSMTKEEVYGLLNANLELLQVEALKDAYIDMYKEAWKSTNEIKTVTDEAAEAKSKYEEALEREATAQQKAADALDNYNRIRSEHHADAGEVERYRQEWIDAEAAAQAATTALDEATKLWQDAEGLKAATIETAEKAIGQLEQLGDAYTDAATKARNAGEDAEEGFRSPFEDLRAILDAAKKYANSVPEEMRKDLDEHSPSKVMYEIGLNAIKGFEEGFKDGADSAKSTVEKEVDGTLDAINESMDGKLETTKATMHTFFDALMDELRGPLDDLKNMMNFEWEFPAPKIPHFNVQWQTIPYGDQGESVDVPDILVEWYAKGGVFRKPTTIGVGENGAEAVVPLENNTGWMDKVAEGITARLQQARFANSLASAFASAQIPAVAGGQIAPYSVSYGSIYDAGGLSSVFESMADILGALVAGFDALQGETQGLREDVQNIEVGDRTIGEANARYLNAQAIMRGRR